MSLLNLLKYLRFSLIGLITHNGSVAFGSPGYICILIFLFVFSSVINPNVILSLLSSSFKFKCFKIAEKSLSISWLPFFVKFFNSEIFEFI